MPWTGFTDDRGRAWRLNQLGLWILIRQHLYNRAIRRLSTIARESHRLGPDRVWVDTDFRSSATERDRESRPMYARLELEVMRDGAQAFQKLAAMRQQTESSVAEVREMQRSASHETFANIELSVARGETGLAIAKQVRDLSATTLVVGSSVMTGGAAVAVLGGGSVLRGVSKYQTSGNIGSAVLSATGSFVVGAIPLGGGSLKAGASLAARVGGESIRYGERAALIVVGAQLDAQFEGATALIEGRSAREALRAAATRFGIDLISGGIGTGLDRWALPVAVRLLTDSAVARGGDTLAAHEPKPEAPEAPAAPRATAAMPAPTAPVCDANSVLSSGTCSARDWVRQIVLQEAR